MGSKGDLNESSEIGTCGNFLQRKLQVEGWTIDDALRAKLYIRSIIQDDGGTDFFTVVPIGLVIESLNERIQQASSEEEKNNILPILYLVEQECKSGTNFYITDGQNRLFNALLPFFNNELRLSDNVLHDLDFEVTKDSVTTSVSLLGKLFKDIPTEIQEYIKNIQVPFAVAEKGNLDSFLDSLIAKNEGISWNDWQKVRVKNAFSEYNKHLLSISEDEKLIDKVFTKLGSGYKPEHDGYEKFVSECLIWMKEKVQPEKNDVSKHEDYLIGNQAINSNMASNLKMILGEISNYNFTKKSNDQLIRNWVMWRYAVMYPSQFKYLNLPKWKIEKKVEFVNQFAIAHAYLYNEEGARTAWKKPDGSKGSFKTPKMYPWANSEYGKDKLELRLTLLADYFLNPKDYPGKPLLKRTEGKINSLIERGVVTVLDSSPMISKEELYYTKPFDHKGSRLDAVEVNAKGLFERGHIIPKSKGGSNQDLVFQDKKSNRSYGATEVDVVSS